MEGRPTKAWPLPLNISWLHCCRGSKHRPSLGSGARGEGWTQVKGQTKNHVSSDGWRLRPPPPNALNFLRTPEARGRDIVSPL